MRATPPRDPQSLDSLLLDRRSLMLGLTATGASIALPGCSSKPTGMVMPPPSMTSGFGTLRSLRDLIRSSPDHLSARAAQVIAAKDFTGAVRFVRDQIAVLPPRVPTDDAIGGVRWGPDGTLRAGAGTQRERIELLNAMLTAMGATAQVAYADLPAGIDATALYKVRPPAFSVDTSKLAVDSATATMLAKINAPFPDLDPTALLSSLSALIPSGQAVSPNPFDGLETRVPIVQYTVNGTTQWAFALGTVDEVDTSPSGFGTAVGVPDYPTISVRLLGAMGNVPGVPNSPGLVELAAGTWTADQLVGSRLIVTTGSPDPASTVGAPPDQIAIRSAVMQVTPSTPRRGNGDPALWSTPAGLAAPATFGGNPFTLSGAQFAAPAQAGDPPTGPYGAVTMLSAADHATALASVASVQVVANGGAFPDVQLTVAALDASNTPVDGLVASDFTVADEGTAQTVTLLSNAGVAQIKVMLAYDCSGSITWPTPADKTAFDTAVTTALVTSATTTPYLLGVAPLGHPPGDGYLAPDATTIQNDIATCGSFSELWYTLGNVAPGDGVSAIVMVSDFQSSDDPSTIAALQQLAAASGVSVALVPISTCDDQTTINTIVSLCGAVVLDYTAADFQQKLTDFVSAATAGAKSSGYRFAYRVPDAQQGTQTQRTATVALAASSTISGTGQYNVPPIGSRGNVGIAGLYLELTLGSDPTLRHRLSGPTLDGFGNPTAAAPSDYDDTRALLSGVVSVAFEPGSPTAAQNADDALSSMLSLEPLQGAVGKTQMDALKAGSSIALYNGPLSLMVDPLTLPSANPVVAPQWMRVVVMTQAIGANVTSHTDLVPELNRAVAASTDGAASFQAVMRAGVALALRESVAMPESAAKALSTATLQYLAPSANPATLTGFTSTDLATWRYIFDEYGNNHLLVPTDPTVGALWVIDAQTGSTAAVSLDGSGGGSCKGMIANAGLQTALAVLQACLAYAMIQCEGSAGESFACVGGLVATVYAIVASLFGGAAFGSDLALDITIDALGLAGAFAPAGFGAAFSVFAVGVAILEGAQGIDQFCL